MPGRRARQCIISWKRRRDERQYLRSKTRKRRRDERLYLRSKSRKVRANYLGTSVPKQLTMIPDVSSGFYTRCGASGGMPGSR